MNMIIGLSVKGDSKWPNPLKELKYNVSVIEKLVKESTSDLILTTKKYNHSLLIDCKSKTIKEKQIKNYLDIRKTPDILIKRGIAKFQITINLK
ncbi:MAG: hypothetical protein B6U87_01505 [Candidatus Aenigmarchaeota archaeon ex4484_52]|nr:MAG: hypothetical protein B6U87_01505 [Candidatus Aenigmarchaeota archaeon ex4484_52]